MIESFRNQDMNAEHMLAAFMDEYFYSRLVSQDGKPLTFKRMDDKESQLRGIDVCIETGGRKIFIDEKASLYYSNAMIPTFAFELDSIQKGHDHPIEGWFINDDLETEYYMLIWPNVRCTQERGQWVRKEIRDIRREDFTIVESMMIKKSDIRDRLCKQGYDRLHLIEYAKRYRELCEKKTGRQEEDILDGIKIMFSGQLAERPINLVIRKELLIEMAKRVYLISADGFATIKG